MPDMFFPTDKCWKNATITRVTCGYNCCGSCLFAAVKTGIQRSGVEHHPGGNRERAVPQARYVRFFALFISAILNVALCRCPLCVRLYLVGMAKEGDWVEIEGYLQLLIMHPYVTILISSFCNSPFRNSLQPKLSRFHTICFPLITLKYDVFTQATKDRPWFLPLLNMLFVAVPKCSGTCRSLPL